MQLKTLACPNCHAVIKQIPHDYHVPVHCDSCGMDFLREQPVLDEMKSNHIEQRDRPKINKKLKTVIILTAVILVIAAVLGVGVLVWFFQMLKDTVN